MTELQKAEVDTYQSILGELDLRARTLRNELSDAQAEAQRAPFEERLHAEIRMFAIRERLRAVIDLQEWCLQQQTQRSTP